MQDRRLTKVKWLVLTLKICLVTIFVTSFIIHFPEMREGFRDGFQDGINAANGKTHLTSYSYSADVIPLKDTVIATSGNKSVVGISVFFVAENPGDPAKMSILMRIGSLLFWVSIFALLLVGGLWVDQFFKFLNSLQRLEIFVPVNVFRLRLLSQLSFVMWILMNYYANFRMFQNAIGLYLDGYEVKSFSWDNVSVLGLIVGMLLWIFSLIWDYVIDLKSENDLTV